jgi:hypothetical protein
MMKGMIDMPLEKTLNAYRKQGMNCAQSIFYGFQEALAIPEETVQAAKQMGGGRAKDGLCGAVYAALELSQDPANAENLKGVFERVAGSVRCHEIRKNKKLGCDGCVHLAASMLAQEQQ